MAPSRTLRALRTGFATVCSLPLRSLPGMRSWTPAAASAATLANLNETLAAVSLHGINNIDERQAARAAAVVLPRPGNAVHFVHGDACRLPFASAAFDRVLAVECIFHFPSRRQFFGEARRVLRRGGKLALSDFILRRCHAGDPR